MKVRQPIMRVRRVEGRAVATPECPPVVALLQPVHGVLTETGEIVTVHRLRGFALKLRP